VRLRGEGVRGGGDTVGGLEHRVGREGQEEEGEEREGAEENDFVDAFTKRRRAKFALRKKGGGVRGLGGGGWRTGWAERASRKRGSSANVRNRMISSTVLRRGGGHDSRCKGGRVWGWLGG
jgi:hypothetical protein